MEINEVKIGDQVTFTHKKKKVTGKVIYRHGSGNNSDAVKAALMGHVNVNIEDGGSYPVTVHVSKLKPALKEETSMNEEKIEHTLDLIDFIASENHVEAEKQFDAILQDKIDIILNAAKQEVAENIFNTQECAECTEKEVEEAVVMKPTPAVQAAIDAYKKKKAAATHDGKTNPPMPAVKKEEVEQTDEALKGGQHKIDVNKNGKLDAMDFKMLRKKKGMKEETQLDELRKSTIGSYIKKAAKDIADTERHLGERRPSAKQRKDDEKLLAQDRKKLIPALGTAKRHDKLSGKHTQRRMKGIETATHKLAKEEVESVDEASYSAKMARAGKDIGKSGKMFSKIAKKASKKYGKERGAKIAGAVLAKLRKKGK
jgi:hypothetical protein